MNEITPGKTFHGFTVLTKEALPEIEGTAYTFFHEHSGARLLYLANDDNNKAFSISFKTPPVDSTGVFHILEHSVLCGSKKFPVKEPFVNLIKSSMQTFLNAMTFPDKTMYPVASTNEHDLLNLMDVYLDAVLNPLIYERKEIFEQEGWHFELDEQTNKLTYNGVVYNEMKGALSNPTSVLFNTLCAGLFPNTTYRFESGGDPQVIPELTYEHYLDTHKRHYRLDNSYLTLYGNLDLDGALSFLDKNYLSIAPKTTFESNPLELQEPVISPSNQVIMQTTPENSCLGLAYVVGSAHDRERVIATEILLDALAGSNEAPLKKALLASNLAGDVQAFVMDSMLQPIAVVQLQDNKPESAEAFQSIVQETLTELCNTGIGHERLEAALAQAEFTMAERDFETADGVILSMQSLAGWLYDDAAATAYLRYEELFKKLRTQIDSGYFEDLLASLFLENNHWACAEIIPVEEKPVEESPLLQALYEDSDASFFEEVDANVANLRLLQEQEDSAEDLARLPLLQISDLVEPPHEPDSTLLNDSPLPCLYHNIPTRHINYLYYYFDLSRLTFEDLPYASILVTLLGKLDTELYSAEQLDTLVQTRLGSLRFFLETHEQQNKVEALDLRLVAGASSLSHNLADLCEIPVHIWQKTLFDSTEKIKDLLLQRKIAMEQGFVSSGHAAAMARCASYCNNAARIRDELGGVSFYLFLKDLLTNFDDKVQELTCRLSDLAKHIFTSDNVIASFTGTPDERDRFWGFFSELSFKSQAATGKQAFVVPPLQVMNEGFIIPADISYVSKGYDYRLLHAPYTSSWQVASRAASFDYLWNEVRVKGGAYGAGLKATKYGALQFYSYRDPELDETLRTFNQTASWLAKYAPSEAELRGYLISTTANHDAPKKPREMARRQDCAYLSKQPQGYRTKEREEILATTLADIRQFGDVVQNAAAQNNLCAFGEKSMLQSAKTDLKLIDLFG